MASDIKKPSKDTPKKNRELGVVLESIDSTVKQTLELVHTHTKQLERLEPMEETLEQVKVDVDAMKITLEAVNLVDLKQQIADLQKRVGALETK